MKLLVICATLGPDGIGDYCRQLVAAMLPGEVSPSLLALNDPDVEPPASKDTISEGFCPIMRLAAALPWPERIEQARRCVGELKPDWVSLHFSPYQWSRRGMDFGLPARLARMFSGVPHRHLMIHEAWKGAKVSAPVKDRIVAIPQSLLLRVVVRRYRPHVIQTQNRVYQEMLRTIGASASLLPLFGNIPIRSLEDDSAPPDLLAITHDPRNWIGGIFGGVLPDWPPESLFPLLLSAARGQGKKLVIVSGGRLASSEAKWDGFVGAYPEINFVKLGPLSPDQVAQFFLRLDFGIATTSWMMITKSSTAASMLDFGLPVIVSTNSWQWRGGFTGVPTNHPRLIFSEGLSPEQLLARLVRTEPRSTAPDVAAQLLGEMRRVDQDFPPAGG